MNYVINQVVFIFHKLIQHERRLLLRSARLKKVERTGEVIQVLIQLNINRKIFFD
jgi:hypothetical protein